MVSFPSSKQPEGILLNTGKIILDGPTPMPGTSTTYASGIRETLFFLVPFILMPWRFPGKSGMKLPTSSSIGMSGHTLVTRQVQILPGNLHYRLFVIQKRPDGFHFIVWVMAALLCTEVSCRTPWQVMYMGWVYCMNTKTRELFVLYFEKECP